MSPFGWFGNKRQYSWSYMPTQQEREVVAKLRRIPQQQWQLGLPSYRLNAELDDNDRRNSTIRAKSPSGAVVGIKRKTPTNDVDGCLQPGLLSVRVDGEEAFTVSLNFRDRYTSMSKQGDYSPPHPESVEKIYWDLIAPLFADHNRPFDEERARKHQAERRLEELRQKEDKTRRRDAFRKL